MVSAAFSQRRKTLRNTLRDLVSVQQLEAMGISPGARAETLTLQQFVAISETIEAEPKTTDTGPTASASGTPARSGAADNAIDDAEDTKRDP